MTSNLKAICFGEVLWDVFPEEERIGGAPLNVASRLSANGIKTSIISQVGNDEKGEFIKSYLEKAGLDTSLLIQDPELLTGMVLVTLNSQGSATYDIAYPAAWDRIKLTPGMVKALEGANAFIYGSLACRDKVSQKTLFTLLEEEVYKIFDVNLRAPHYQTAVLEHLMYKADFIKFNDDELNEIARELGSKFIDLEKNLLFLAEKTNTSTICVTKGSQGATLLSNKKLYNNSGYKVHVKDTVGAGDSFLASLISGLLKNEDPQKTLDYACAVGALVAASEGANPELKEEEIRELMGIL